MTTLSAEKIIYQHLLTFDPGDTLNGSLYLGEPINGVSESRTSSAIDSMREEGIWSDEPSRRVPEEFRQAYNEQLEFVDCASYEEGQFIIARFDHPKFPSSNQRWDSWMSFFDQRYSRDR